MAAEHKIVTVAGTLECYLSSMINDSVDFLHPSIKKQNIIQAIEEYTLFSSKARHRGSLTMLACVIHSYYFGDSSFDIITRNGDYTTNVCHAFNPTHGDMMRRGTCLLPKSIVQKMESSYPSALLYSGNRNRPPAGYSRFIHYLSKTYATCASNHFKSNLFIYQRYTVINFLESLGYNNPKRTCSGAIEELMRKINNWPNVNSDNNEEEEEIEEEDGETMQSIFSNRRTKEFVSFHRSFFKKRGLQDQIIDPDWIEEYSNLKYIPLYFIHLLRYQDMLQKQYENVKVKRLNVLPLHKMSVSHIDIDTICLYYILKEAGFRPDQHYGPGPRRLLFPRSETGITSRTSQFPEDWWAMIFDIKRGCTGSRTMFHYPLGLRSNGVVASFLYQKRFALEVEEERVAVEEGADDEEDADAAVDVEGADDEEGAEEEERVGENLENQNPPPHQPQQHQDGTQEQKQMIEIVGGVDPGRVSLFVLCFAEFPTNPNARLDEQAFSVKGLPGHFEYTSANHRHNSKVSYLVKYIEEAEKRNNLNIVYKHWSEKHLKTPNLRCLFRAIRARTSRELSWNDRWEMKSKKGLRRIEMYVKGQKKSALQTQMCEVKRTVKKLPVAKN